MGISFIFIKTKCFKENVFIEIYNFFTLALLIKNLGLIRSKIVMKFEEWSLSNIIRIFSGLRLCFWVSYFLLRRRKLKENNWDAGDICKARVLLSSVLWGLISAFWGNCSTSDIQESQNCASYILGLTILSYLNLKFLKNTSHTRLICLSISNIEDVVACNYLICYSDL